MIELKHEHGDNPFPEQVIILVHGTALLRRIFPRRITWVEGDSTFCHKLRQSLGDYHIVIYSFHWSGRNSVAEQSKAAMQLRSLLQECARRYPLSRVALIAHSHGGNIALRALALEPRDPPRERVVCLSTPILAATARPFANSKEFEWMALSSLIAGGAIATFIVSASLRMSFYVFLIAAAVLVALIVRFGRITLSAYKAHSQLIADELNFQNALPTFGVLFIRNTSDEASLLLTSFQALQYVMNLLLEAGGKVVSRSWKAMLQGDGRGGLGWRARLMLPAMAIVLGSRVVPAFVPWLGTALQTIGMALMLPFCLSLTVWLWAPVMGVLMWIDSIFLILGGILPFGFRLAVASLWFEISVEPFPPGRWNTFVLSSSPAKRGLRHSHTYLDDGVMPAIRKHLAI